jgi:hypothetical protein
MHSETNTKRTKNLVLLTTLDFMKSFWNHNNPTLDFIYPISFIRFLKNIQDLRRILNKRDFFAVVID